MCFFRSITSLRRYGGIQRISGYPKVRTQPAVGSPAARVHAPFATDQVDLGQEFANYDDDALNKIVEEQNKKNILGSFVRPPSI